MRWIVFLAVLLPGGPPADLTGLWHAAFTAPGGAKRELHLAIRTDGTGMTGQVESPTRRASLVDGKLRKGGFSAIAESDWDGTLARRPVEGHLRDGVLHVRIQAWPDGPMADYEMRRISNNPTIPRITPVPPPPLRKLPDNGLARVPPMGWSSWNRFGCQVNDQLIREMAGAMVSSGLRDVGYTYINIDDCWQGERDSLGNIKADPARFPDMKALTDYVHSKGLKIGIYSSPGPRTCAGYEGSYGHEEQDARTFARWGFDLLKYDWCSAGKLYTYDDMQAVFQKMGVALLAAGRPIVYSICQYGLARVWEWGADAGGNLWRTTGDIADNWKSISEIAFEKTLPVSRFARPGHWNDPDMLEVGNGGMSLEEYRTHMTLWAMLSAPLLAGNDLRTMTPEIRDLLGNREIISVNQDPFGKPVTRISKKDSTEVWRKLLHDGSFAVGIFNRTEERKSVSLQWSDMGFDEVPARVRDLWRRSSLEPLQAGYSASIPAHGSVLLRVSGG